MFSLYYYGPEIHRRSMIRTSWRTSVHRKGSIRRRSRKKTCKLLAVSTPLFPCNWAWLWWPMSPRSFHRHCNKCNRIHKNVLVNNFKIQLPVACTKIILFIFPGKRLLIFRNKNMFCLIFPEPRRQMKRFLRLAYNVAILAQVSWKQE